MINKDILIKNLEDFKDTKKYSLKKLAEFLSSNEITKDFYQKHVNKINQYKQKNPKLLVKLSKDKYYFKQKSANCFNPHYKYDKKELNIIQDNILDKHLITFLALSLELNENFTTKDCGKVIFNLIFDVYEDNKEIEDLIDYIIKFCILPYSENQIVDINLTGTEQLVLEYIHNGLSVPQIAEEMTCSKNTIENHKKNICKKIDNLNQDEYKNLKALAKLHLLAQKIIK